MTPLALTQQAAKLRCISGGGGTEGFAYSTHLVRSRMGSLRVARYRLVLKMAKLNSQT